MSRPLVARPGRSSSALAATLQEGIAKFYDESTPRACPWLDATASHVRCFWFLRLFARLSTGSRSPCCERFQARG